MRSAAATTKMPRSSDDSQTYYWRLLAAKEIMHLYRADRSKLERLAALQTAKASAEEVLHPPDSTDRLHTLSDLEQAWRAAPSSTCPTIRPDTTTESPPAWENSPGGSAADPPSTAASGRRRSRSCSISPTACTRSANPRHR